MPTVKYSWVPTLMEAAAFDDELLSVGFSSVGELGRDFITSPEKESVFTKF